MLTELTDMGQVSHDDPYRRRDSERDSRSYDRRDDRDEYVYSHA